MRKKPTCPLCRNELQRLYRRDSSNNFVPYGYYCPECEQIIFEGVDK